VLNYEDVPEIFKEQFIVSLSGEKNIASEKEKNNIFQY